MSGASHALYPHVNTSETWPKTRCTRDEQIQGRQLCWGGVRLDMFRAGLTGHGLKEHGAVPTLNCQRPESFDTYPVLKAEVFGER